jgi:hypothetical protein
VSRADPVLPPLRGGTKDWYYEVILGDLELSCVFAGNTDACHAQGVASRMQAMWRTKNPYAKDSAEWFAWDAGWEAVDRMPIQ